MNLITDYLARAAEARKAAEAMTDPRARAELMKIAEVCERLAARHPGPLTLPPELDPSPELATPVAEKPAG